MKLLPDESVDRRLGASFPDTIEVQAVRGMGWLGARNGDLIRRAAALGFDALITADANIGYQQNLAHLPLTIIVLRANRTRLQELQPLVPMVLSILDRQPGKTLVSVRATPLDDWTLDRSGAWARRQGRRAKVAA